MTAPAKSGKCIVCLTETTDRTQTGVRANGRPTYGWRCDDGLACALRRNARKARPRPDAEIRADHERRMAS